MSDEDKIDAAIRGVSLAEAVAAEQVPLVQQNLILSSSGRPAIVAHPEDMTDPEIMDICAFLMLQLAPALRARKAAARIEIVRSMPEGRPS